MTERPMWDGGPAEHPDEGTIHAWLDDALDGDSAGRVAAHVGSCADCTARVAEARGLIAGASRIVAALDDSPTTARPPWAQAADVSSTEGTAPGAGTRVEGPAGASLWRWLRVTPARAAIAATILVAVGVTLTHERVAEESTRRDARPMVAVHDETELRRGAQGGATVERAPGPAIAQPPSVAAAEPAPEPAQEARERVAIGRAAVRAQRETTAARADRVRTEVTAPEADTRAAKQEIAAAGAATRAAAGAPAPSSAKSAPRESPASGNAAGMATSQRRPALAGECYRIEAVRAGTRWASERLPVLVRVEAGPGVGVRAATVRPAAVAEPSRRATWTRTAADSVRLTLDEGSDPPILMGAESGGRAGSIGGGAGVRVQRVECGGG